MLRSAAMSASRRIGQLSGQIRNSSTGTMKGAVVASGPKVTIRDASIPVPGPHQVVTKVVFSGTNPKDWKRPQDFPDKPPLNQGDDIAGYVHQVGEHVYEFKPGDRIIAFHQMMKPGGSYAEYAVSDAHTTAHLPTNVSFQEGAAVPLAALTAASGLFARLQLPAPWLPATRPIPLIVYGAASAVGSYAVQLAQRAKIHPVICVAGRGIPHVKSLIDPSKGDIVIDYRSGSESVVKQLQAAASKHGKIQHAIDTAVQNGSYGHISQALDTSAPGASNIALAMAKRPNDGLIHDNITTTFTAVGSMHGIPDDLRSFGFVYLRYIARALGTGELKAHPQEKREGGLEGVEGALRDLKEGKASAVKYVVRIADTPGVSDHPLE